MPLSLQSSVESTGHAAQAATHYHQADCLQHQGQFEAAIDQYTAALVLDPQQALALQQRAKLYHAYERYADALHDINASIHIHPTDVQSYFIRSMIHFDMQQYAQANQDWMLAKPHFNHHPTAIKHADNIQRALLAEKIYSLGLMHYQNGNYPAAITAFKEAIIIWRYALRKTQKPAVNHCNRTTQRWN